MARFLGVAAFLMAWVAMAPAWAQTAATWHRSVAIEIRVGADGRADTVETWSVRGDTTAVSHSLAQQTFSAVTDLEEVTLLGAATLKADGRQIPVGPDAVMNQAVTTASYAPQFSAVAARTIVFPSVGAGDTVRYTLRRQGTATLFAGAFTTTLRPGSWAYMDAADISIALPPGMAVRVEAAGLAEAAPELLADGGVVRRWSLASQAGRGEPVVLDVSSFADYAALGEAYARRAWPRSEPGPAVRALAERLTAGIQDEREQALMLYRYVATETRYVATFLGDGRVVPRDSAVVLAEGFGDCKDHAALLQALLTARGIRSIPALISLRALYSLPNAPGLGALNHVITFVPSLDLYLDSTAPYAPFGLLPASEYDKPVVLSEPGAARVARTPAVPPVPLTLRTTTEAQIGDDDVISGTTTTDAAGPQSIALRSMAAWIEGRGAAGAASAQLRQLGTPGTGGFTFDPPDGPAPQPGVPMGTRYQVRARFTLDEALLEGGEAPFPLPSGLGMFDRPGKMLLGSARTEEGRNLCYPGQEVEDVSLSLPDGGRLVAVPSDVSTVGGGARYESHYRAREGVLHVRREFTVTTARVFCDAAEYDAMRGVLAAARRDQRVQVALDRGVVAEPD